MSDLCPERTTINVFATLAVRRPRYTGVLTVLRIKRNGTRKSVPLPAPLGQPEPQASSLSQRSAAGVLR